MIAIMVASLAFDICLAAILLVYARRHYAIHKAMHLRVATLMTDKTEPGEQEQPGYDQREDQNVTHGASPIRP